MPAEKPLKFFNRKWKTYHHVPERQLYQQRLFEGEWTEVHFKNEFFSFLEQPPAFTVRSFLGQFIYEYWEEDFFDINSYERKWAATLLYQHSEN